MPQPYSADLPERVLVACERGGGSQVEIARRFQVCPATVSNWRRQAREEGRRQSKSHSGGVPPRLDASALQVLRQLVIEDNDAMLREYAERLAERTDVTICLAVICEALKRLKLRPKKDALGGRAGSARDRE
ncbi:helix-turn-helix domain-containing protein [Microvirga vignae]|nr:helix-turn-helix domain-containing protein [Microvirga vignae]